MEYYAAIKVVVIKTGKVIVIMWSEKGSAWGALFKVIPELWNTTVCAEGRREGDVQKSRTVLWGCEVTGEFPVFQMLFILLWDLSHKNKSWTRYGQKSEFLYEILSCGDKGDAQEWARSSYPALAVSMRLQDGGDRGQWPVGRKSGQRSQDSLHGSLAPPRRCGPGGSDARVWVGICSPLPGWLEASPGAPPPWCSSRHGAVFLFCAELSPKFACWNSDLPDLSMWVYLEMGPLKRWLRYKVIYWALIQHDRCPYKKKRLGPRSRVTMWGDKEKVATDKPRERPEDEASPCRHLDLGLWLPEWWEKFISVV